MKTYYLAVRVAAFEAVKANSPEEALKKYLKMTPDQRKRRLMTDAESIVYEWRDEDDKLTTDGIFCDE